MRCGPLFLLYALFQLVVVPRLWGQGWDFIKEKDGIKIYTRNQPNSQLKSFKGEITFKADFHKVNLIVGDARNIDWWDKDIIEKRVLAFEENKMIRYNLVYNVPWPLSKRDLALEANISIDPHTGDRIVASKPVLNLVPEKEELVRIKNYWQK